MTLWQFAALWLLVLSISNGAPAWFVFVTLVAAIFCAVIAFVGGDFLKDRSGD